MKVDIGFWNEQGKYIPDIQEIGAVEMDKNFNEFFDELNDMANFKNFGEQEETEQKEIIIDGVDVAGCCQFVEPEHLCRLGGECKGWDNCYYKQLKRLEQENADLKKYIERMDKPVVEVVDADIALENTELKEKNTALEETLQTIEQLKDEDSLRIAQLVTENARLKEEIKEVKKYQYEQEFLEKEIEEQREKNKRLTCKILEVKALNETLNVQCTSQDCTQLRKLHQTLQEIKAIAEAPKPFIDFSETKTATEIEYDYAAICNELELRLHKVLDLIIKAEEE